jgi:hypothetical protein
MSELTTLTLPLPLGFTDTATATGLSVHVFPDGVFSDHKTQLESLRATYTGSAAELTWHKAQRQEQLDNLLDNNFDLKAFIRAGTATNVTGTNIGNFLATINNNYRTKRAAIAAAATVAAVAAVAINAGWPNNP